MTFNEKLNEAFRLVREQRFDGKTDGELQEMIATLNHYHQNSPNSTAKAGADTIQQELFRRQVDKGQTENRCQHSESLDELREIQKTIVLEQGKLKDAIDRLAHPRLIDWAILVVGIVAAVASVIGYWPQIAAVFRALIPAP